MDLRASIPGVAVTITLGLVVMVRAAVAPAPGVGRHATAEERAEIAAAIAASERGWRDESAQSFPEDDWSQSDDFHAKEAKKARELAGKAGVRIEDVLGAVDDDLHRARARSTSPDPRGARAVPCKPRPFYD